MIKPTVGRKVWYFASDNDLRGPKPMQVSGSYDAGTLQPLDATVIAVWGDRCINALVTDVNGNQFTKTSITLRQPDDAVAVDADGRAIRGHAEWMPYQASQAKKD